eukprot:2213248-Rhodomonas_salina.2
MVQRWGEERRERRRLGGEVNHAEGADHGEDVGCEEDINGCELVMPHPGHQICQHAAREGIDVGRGQRGRGFVSLLGHVALKLLTAVPGASPAGLDPSERSIARDNKNKERKRRKGGETFSLPGCERGGVGGTGTSRRLYLCSTNRVGCTSNSCTGKDAMSTSKE